MIETAVAVRFRPLHDRVLILPDEPDLVSPGGIIIPDQAQGRAEYGIVLAVGPGDRMENGERKPMTVKAGDHVAFGRYAGTEMEIDGDKVFIMHEEECFGVVEGGS